MYVYIGGAYNGKRQFVKDFYQAHVQHVFEGQLPDPAHVSAQDVIIIGRFELLIQHYKQATEDEIVAMIMEKLKRLDEQATVICICTDIGRGIVPIEKEQRFLRDTCGRLYQAMFAHSKQVTRIWYGIPQILKGV